MKINVSEINTAFLSLIQNPNQIVFLDANVFIPPDKRNLGATDRVHFPVYKNLLLTPLFQAFPRLSIHEAVNKEIIVESTEVRAFVDEKISDSTYRMIVYKDADLDENSLFIRNTLEEKIYPHTKYNPDLDNANDRGEVKTLAYIGATNLLYFASNDQNALRLVEAAEQLETGLDSVSTLHIYEILYYFTKIQAVDQKELRILYKYMYYYTAKEKKDNPSWGEFISIMDSYYAKLLSDL